MEEYAIYLRKSRKDMELERYGEGETLARHKAALLDLAKRKQLNITEIYEEIVSGESIAARPEMQRLLVDVENNRFDGVLVMELERLARGDTKDQGTVAEAFKFTHTLIITPQKTYNPMNEFDEEYFEFGLFMSRREYKTINRRLQAGRLASVKEGNYIGSSAPFGYDKVRTGHKSYTLTPNENAEYVRMIYDMYTSQNYTLGQIADRLNDLNIKPLKSDKWAKVSIRDMLSNPVYIGKIRWNWRPNKKVYVDGEIKIIRPRQSGEDVTIIDGNHPAIIDIETFEKAQELRRQNFRGTSVNKNLHVINPFAKLMKCRQCGKAITLQKYTKGNTRLVCGNKYCDVSSCDFETVEEFVLLALQDKIGEMRVMSQQQLNRSENEAKVIQAQIKKVQKELDILETQQSKLYDLLEQGIYTQEIFLERQATLSQKKTDFKEKLIQLRETIPPPPIDFERTITNVKRVLEDYPNADPEEQNELLSGVISRIWYDREKSNRFHQNPVKIELEIKF